MDARRSRLQIWEQQCLSRQPQRIKKATRTGLGAYRYQFLIGRLSDSGFYRRRDKKRINNPDWDTVRKAQESFDASERAVWIDTDDLNGEKGASLHKGLVVAASDSCERSDVRDSQPTFNQIDIHLDTVSNKKVTFQTQAARSGRNCLDYPGRHVSFLLWGDCR